MHNKNFYIKATEKWLHEYVLAFNLCPFAKTPVSDNRVKLEVLFFESDFDKILIRELRDFAIQKEYDTKLLVIPELSNYDDHVEVYYVMQEMIDLDELKVTLVSFHPESVYGSFQNENVVNYINRAPYPIIQLLKKDVLDQLELTSNEKEEILNRNQETMEKLGVPFLSQKLDEFRKQD